ncbi:MAG: cytochrome c-type biogenesis protein CcmH [Acidimicrobiia bacterium]|nr:cytochrome c-type biogenesis protein CcmH [Acidimicrobiia bacterium]NNF63733.1 cytochrome c-type biogenesis protein CcmH [Acidimicrobiia bacterium]
MRSRLGSVVRWAVALMAIAIIVGGLAFDQPDTRSAEQRADDIASSLRCPFCEGVSIAESTSQVARDLQAIIRERVDEGAGDEAITGEFVARYGEWVLLSPPASGIGLALWALPIAGLVAGAVAVAGLRRRSDTTDDRDLPSASVPSRVEST